MSDAWGGLLGFIAALTLIAFGVPVAVSMAAIGGLGFWWFNGWAGLAFIAGSTPFEAIFPYSFSVIPLFVMMGVFASHAGLSKSLFDVVNGFLGLRHVWRDLRIVAGDRRHHWPCRDARNAVARI